MTLALKFYYITMLLVCVDYVMCCLWLTLLLLPLLTPFPPFLSSWSCCDWPYFSFLCFLLFFPSSPPGPAYPQSKQAFTGGESVSLDRHPCRPFSTAACNAMVCLQSHASFFGGEEPVGAAAPNSCCCCWCSYAEIINRCWALWGTPMQRLILAYQSWCCVSFFPPSINKVVGTSFGVPKVFPWHCLTLLPLISSGS